MLAPHARTLEHPRWPCQLDLHRYYPDSCDPRRMCSTACGNNATPHSSLTRTATSRHRPIIGCSPRSTFSAPATTRNCASSRPRPQTSSMGGSGTSSSAPKSWGPSDRCGSRSPDSSYVSGRSGIRCRASRRVDATHPRPRQPPGRIPRAVPRSRRCDTHPPGAPAGVAAAPLGTSVPRHRRGAVRPGAVLPRAARAGPREGDLLPSAPPERAIEGATLTDAQIRAGPARRVDRHGRVRLRRRSGEPGTVHGRRDVGDRIVPSGSTSTERRVWA